MWSGVTLLVLWLLHGALLMWWDWRHATVPPWMRWAFRPPWYANRIALYWARQMAATDHIVTLPGGEVLEIVGHSTFDKALFVARMGWRARAARFFLALQTRLCWLLYLPFDLAKRFSHTTGPRLDRLALWLYGMAVEPWIWLGGRWTIIRGMKLAEFNLWLKHQWLPAFTSQLSTPPPVLENGGEPDA